MNFDCEPYVAKINNPRYKELFRTILLKLPDYFYTASASSSGKYHSSQDVGEGGLLRHSIKVFKIMCYMTELECVKEELALEMDDRYNLYLSEAIDLLKIAAFIHDGVKYGINPENLEHTEHSHPLLMAAFLMDMRKELMTYVNEIDYIISVIKTHHGSWSTSKYDLIILPRPKTYAQKLLHQCDYLGSRKDIIIELPELNSSDNPYQE